MFARVQTHPRNADGSVDSLDTVECPCARVDAPSSGYTQSGYGSRIPCNYMVYCRRAWRRVYAICHSNVSSLYVRIGGKRYFVDSIED